MVVKVGVNGYGTIGRRIADAVTLQPDMKLVGIAKTGPDYKSIAAIRKGYDIYSATEKGLKSFEEEDIPVKGTVRDLLRSVDVVVDATPGGIGRRYKPIYEEMGVNAIFQGGEKADVADVSFVAQCNYEKAYGKGYIRCVSCNTTGLCRTLHALDQAFGVKRARGVLIRRGSDPDDIGHGPMNAVVPDPITVPSHQGPDVNTVLPGLPIVTVALKTSVTHMHLHALSVTLESKGVNEEGVTDLFDETPRVVLISGKERILSTAHVIDMAKDLGRSRGDVYEIPVWSESVSIIDDELYYLQAVHSEADVILENIDAIRASMKLMRRDESMKLTDETLNVLRSWSVL
ncbi:MAG: type II glyceraldehyde-3-phosphate dehydrogenase [Candidatus Bathyarchaeia archaeon]